MFYSPDLFGTAALQRTVLVEPWRPRMLTIFEWRERRGPEYRRVYAWRLRQLDRLRKGEIPLDGAKDYYRQHKAEFIMDWMDTYDPRLIGRLKWMPFVFFERQSNVIQFFDELYSTGESGLIEKCRDVGITWLACAWSVATWLFEPDAAIGWGSRVEDLVDTIGDVSSIFEKLRRLIMRLPREFLPAGFNAKRDLTYMKCINPENMSTIVGETGKNIGRGGRTGIYFKDESAHYEQPESIEAALGDNTRVQVDISSVNGTANPFYKRRKAGVDWEPGKAIDPGVTRVLIVDWRDHPDKTQAWYDQRRAKWEAEGMLHLFAQEVERNYSAAISNTIIAGEWVLAAIDADKKIPGMREGGKHAGFDPADEGGDTNAFVGRTGVTLTLAQEWGSRDPGVSARRAIGIVRDNGYLQCEYDPIGIGATVKSEWNRLTLSPDGITPPEIIIPGVDWADGQASKMFNPWNAGAKVQWPFKRVIDEDESSPYIRDFYGNLKAQGWYALRQRFIRTWQAVTQNIKHDPSTLISISSEIAVLLLRKIEDELKQPTSDKNGSMKMIVEKKPNGSKSPNLADAIMMCYFPSEGAFAAPLVGTYGNG